MHPKYKYSIDDQQIFVIDGAFDPGEVRAISQEIYRRSWTRTAFSRKDTRQFRDFVAAFPLMEMLEASFCEKIVGVTETCFPQYCFWLHKVICNIGLYGDCAHVHRDFEVGHNCVTSLLYANESWKRDWGGESIFYNYVGDAVVAVNPVPGRVVIFDSAIEHRTGLVQRECYEPRFVIAYQFLTSSRAGCMALPRFMPEAAI